MLKKGESQNTEFKKSTAQMERALKAMCGFLNHKGGCVYFGISDNNELIGQDVTDSTLKSLSQKIRQKIKPEVSPEIKVPEIDGRKVIEVKIKEGRNKPYYLDGIAYKRTGTESPPIAAEELERIILVKNRIQWDSQICEEATLDSIDAEKVKLFLGKTKAERKIDINERTSIPEILEKLAMMNGTDLTSAAMLLFGKYPQKFFLQAEIRCAKFKGVEAVKPFLDMKVIGGTIFQQADEAEKFVLNNIKKAAWIEPGKIERQEKWEYPMDAVREAIINAICHRDYDSPSNVQIRIFDDRLEVWNPGRLPDGWTVETLRKKHESRPHNHIIAKVFFLAGYIEQWGTGTTDIIKEAKVHGLPEPIFEDTGTSIVIIFRKYYITEEVMKTLPEAERRIIAYVQQKGMVSRKDCIELLNVSRATASRYFESLENKKIIKRKGTGKNIHYVLA